MKLSAALASISLMILTASCGGGAAVPAAPAPALEALYGTSLRGVAVTTTAAGTELRFTEFAGPCIVAVHFPDTASLHWSWDHADVDVASFAAREDGHLVAAVLPRNDAAPAPITLTITRGAGDSLPAAVPPRAGDLTAELADGQVVLSWDEDVPGDYDFDGAVTTRDLLPLARACAHGLNEQLQDASPWLDGNADGVVNQSDSDVLAANLGLRVSGYRVFCNSSPVPGVGQDGTVVGGPSTADAPRHYAVSAAGSLDDCWTIVPVDAAGRNLGPGTFAGGGTLQARIDISGMDLLPIDDERGKIGTRVILPIENTDDSDLIVPIQVMDDGAVEASNIPRGRLVLLEVTYRPAGAAAGEDGLVRTNVALTIPRDTDSLVLDADITLQPATAGSLGLLLNTTATGDSLAPVASAAHLDLSTGVLRRDTNDNGSFSDELSFPDTDRDCISDALQHQLTEGLTAGVAVAPMRIAGRLAAIDPSRGRLTISTVRVLDGGVALPPTVDLHFAENMRLYHQDGIAPRVGEMAEVVVYKIVEDHGQCYWASSLHQLASGYISEPVVSAQPGGAQILSWKANEALVGYRLVRYSAPAITYVPGDPFNLGAPSLVQNWSRQVAAGSTRYVDNEIMPGLSYSYELYGTLPGGQEEYLGMFRSID